MENDFKKCVDVILNSPSKLPQTIAIAIQSIPCITSLRRDGFKIPEWTH